jgi:hypothetical protein
MDAVAIAASDAPQTSGRLRSDAHPSDAHPSWLMKEAGVVLATVLALACAILHYGLFQFGGMDGGVCSKGAWMGHLGYRPYVDFPAVCSPDYLLVGKLAFALFGIKWISFVYLGAWVSGVSFVFHWLLLRELPISVPVRWLVAVSTQLCTYVPLGWVSYNQTASVVGSIFITALAAVLLRRGKMRLYVYLVIATVCLLMVKPNIAGFLGVTGYGVLLLQRRLWKWAVLCIVSALLLWAAVLWSQGISPFVLARHYASAKGRLGRWEMLVTCLYDSHREEAMRVLPIIAALGFLCQIYVFGALVRLPKAMLTSPHYLLALLGIAAGSIALATNNEISLVEAPLFICAATVLVYAVPHAVFGGFFPRSIFVATFLCLVIMIDLFAARITYTRYRIAVIGPGSFYEPGPTSEFGERSFFRGMHCSSRLVAVDEQIPAVLDLFDSRRDLGPRVFFGPRIEFGYPAFGLAVPKGLPLWWPGTGETSEMEIATYVRTFEEADFKVCLFLKNDFTYIPVEVRRYLAKSYFRLETGELTVFVRRMPGEYTGRRNPGYFDCKISEVEIDNSLPSRSFRSVAALNGRDQRTTGR